MIVKFSKIMKKIDDKKIIEDSIKVSIDNPEVILNSWKVLKFEES